MVFQEAPPIYLTRHTEFSQFDLKTNKEHHHS